MEIEAKVAGKTDLRPPFYSRPWRHHGLVSFPSVFFKASKPQSIKASKPQSLKASKPQRLNASTPQRLNAPSPKDQVRPAYWAELMEQGYAMVQQLLAFPVEECGERFASLPDLATAGGIERLFSTTKIAGNLDRIYFMRANHLTFES